MVRRWLAASAALVCSTLYISGAFAVGTVDPVGKWQTGRGPLTIEKAADGSFTFVFEKFPGKMTGEIYSYGDGDLRMKGAWWDIETVKACGQESDGSKHWGGFDVTFHGPPTLDREVFGGIWTFCELSKPMPTDGTPQVTEGWSFSGQKVK